MAHHLVASIGLVSRIDRERLLGQQGAVVWFTGLSGSGKSTIARLLEAELTCRGRLCYVLDGDNLRGGLNADLGFSAAARTENIRRVGEVAALFADAGLIVLVAFISPFRADRDRARARVPAGRFIEVFVDAPLATCELRDPKGFYKKARAGEIADFTGISSPYEPPAAPELVLDTAQLSPTAAVSAIVSFLERKKIIGKASKSAAQSVAHRRLNSRTESVEGRRPRRPSAATEDPPPSAKADYGGASSRPPRDKKADSKRGCP